ncbi:hypothetical protein OH76DRAFT_1551896 [Lentinus brumalis]|uniref:Uncharacterized protein n=1 Tax=Lentinus brumalis TaxID=2498619 RepID=A0A371DSD8_9APHY|nr:hypothetical protein OH76DRAFT_1551896 [Polyporus brumalis]
MAYDESSDILGGRLHVSPPRSSAWSDPGQISLLLGLGLAALYAWIRVAPHYRQWRETRYRKAMRRRHGIPDDDNRPFNVAYAAALQARKGKDGRGRGRGPLEDEVPLPSHDGEDERLTGAVPQYLPPPSYVSGGYSNIYPVLDRDDAVSRPNIDASSVQADAHPTSSPVGSFERKSRANGVKGALITRSSHGKHALDEERDSESETQAKKTRLDRNELPRGDEDAGWHGSNEDMEVDEVQPAKRGSKRVASSEDDEGRPDRLDKRARKVSIDRSPQSVDDDMQEDEEDSGIAVRGKKRDRTEAESTFGGDDSILDDDEKPRRRRRRRNGSNKFVQDSSRGQKRARDSHSHDSDDSDSELTRRPTTRKKRGRRSQDEVAPLSTDPLCKGRRIGEEWESNGIRFKVGPNGQRLRQELVKKSRSRFPMPSDSYHPDRRAHVDVYVEMWLSEEEYQAAKERHELAWQDAPPTPPEPQTPGDVPDSPSKAGKSLLWSSATAPRESPTKRGPFRQSVVTNVGFRLNAFPAAPVPSTRRISTVYQAPSSPATDSPKLQKTKSYSKWEKQDLEAAAMSKIRARQQAAGADNKALPSASSTTSPLNTTSASAATKAPEKPAPSFGFAPSAASTATSKPAAPEMPKFNVPATTPAPTASSTEPTKAAAPSFSFAPSSGTAPTATPSTTPAMSAPQPAGAPQAGSSVPNFFSKPATQTPAPSAAPTTTPSTSAPNFFAPKAPAPASSATPATNGNLATNAAQGQGSGAPKPTFSFGTTPSAQPSGHAPSPFGNATNASGTAKTDQSKAAPAPGTSLLSRLGMGPPPSQPTVTSTPTFSFGKPDATPASTSAAGPDASKAAAAPSSGPKFSFGVTSKPSTAAPSSTPAANGVGASSSPATSTPTFGFGVGNSSSQPAASNTSSPFGAPANKDPSAPSAPKSVFAFGGSTPANNAFGGASSTPAASSPFGGASNSAAKPAEAPKSAFAFGGNTSATNTSPSGAAPSPSAPFGAPGSRSGDPQKPTEAQKSAFSFGAGAGSATSSSSTQSFFGGGANAAQKPDGKTDGQASKPTFAFSGSSSTPAFGSSSTPSGSSAFGSSSKPAATPAFGTTSAFGGSSTPASTSAFGASSTPTSAFGSSSTPAFGATTTPGAPASGSKPTFSFGFGASSTPAAANTTENKPASTFNFGATSSNNATTPAASGFGSQPANGSAPSPFGAPSSTASGTGAFNFGASSGAFSFGANQNGQK